MTRPPARGSRRWAALFLTGILALLWTAYRVANARHSTGRMTLAAGCDTDSTTAADLSRLVPGAGLVPCIPWDIGTGVTGYAWTAPRPRAALLLQVAWGDYAQRYVTQGNRLIPQLLAHGVTVYAFDMWGSGRSPGRRGATDVRQAVADHLTARAVLRRQPLPVFALGHSVGGLVTAAAALRDPDGLEGLILLAPALKWDVPGAMRAVARVAGFLAPTLPVPGSGGAVLTRDPEAQRRLDQDPMMAHGPIPWVTASTGLAVSRESWPEYGTLRMPVLIVHGGADRAPDTTGSQEFLARLAAPDRTLRVIPGALHGLLDDTSGDEVLRIILEWLDRRLPGDSAAPRAP